MRKQYSVNIKKVEELTHELNFTWAYWLLLMPCVESFRLPNGQYCIQKLIS